MQVTGVGITGTGTGIIGAGIIGAGGVGIVSVIEPLEIGILTILAYGSLIFKEGDQIAREGEYKSR